MALLLLTAAAILAASHLIIDLRSGQESPYPLTDPSRIQPSDLADFPSPAVGIRFFQGRLRQNPEDFVSLTLLGQLYLQEARQTGDVASYGRAETALLEALRILPGYPAAKAALASAHYATHDFIGALELAEELYQLNPRRTDLLAIIADAHLSLGHYEQAAPIYQALLERKSSPSILARLAHQAELHGNPEQALELMQRAAGEALFNNVAKEEMAWYLIRLGDLHFNAGEIRAAEQHYRAALRLYPDYALALADVGKARAALGRLEEAIEFYRRATEIIPQPEQLAALGDLYTIQGEQALAQRQYDTVVFIGNLAEINRQVYNRQLANFYSDHDLQPEQALKLALSELEVRKDVFGYDAAAWAYFKNGQLDQAQRMIDIAMKLGTRDAKLYYHAGMIAFGRGDPAAAERLLSEAIAINPFFDTLQARIARSVLAGLSPDSPATILRRPR